MGTEEGGAHNRRHRFADAGNHAEHLQLVVGGQTVAALYLDGSGAFCHYFAHTNHCLAVELILRGFVEQVGAVENTSAPGGYLLITEAVYFVEELTVAGSGVDYVGVGVAECREEPTSAGVDNLFALQLASLEVRHFAERRDSSPVVDSQPGVGQLCGARFHLRSGKPLHSRREDTPDGADVEYQHEVARNWIDFSI